MRSSVVLLFFLFQFTIFGLILCLYLLHKFFVDRESYHNRVHFDRPCSYDNNWHSLCDFPSYLLTITFSISCYLVQIPTTSMPATLLRRLGAQAFATRHTPALLCAHAPAEHIIVLFINFESLLINF